MSWFSERTAAVAATCPSDMKRGSNRLAPWATWEVLKHTGTSRFVASEGFGVMAS